MEVFSVKMENVFQMWSFLLIVNPFPIIVSVFFCHIVHSQCIGALQPPTAMTLSWQHFGKFKTSSCNFLFSKMASTLSFYSLQISMFVVFIFLLFKNMTSTLLCPSVCLSKSFSLPSLPSFISRLVDRSVFSHWVLLSAEGNLLTGLVAFLFLFCSHSVSRQLSLRGFRKKRGRGRWVEE